jgi:hypothetical protein
MATTTQAATINANIESDELTSEQMMSIYMVAFGDDDELDAMPPIVAKRCDECFMLIDELEEHHCIRR